MPALPSSVAGSADAGCAIDLHEIAQRLGHSWALRGVTLEIPPGELVAIVGHNGSGKTTLLRVIATALRATRGRGTVFGHDLRRDANAVRGISSMLTYGAGLYGDLSAVENLTFAQRMAGEPLDMTVLRQVLDHVGLAKAADARVRTFSSGMQRRASLARLFLRPTPLVLLDEPYNSLDPGGGRLVDELLLGVRARQGVGLVVLHDLDRSGVAFDRIVELRQGRVVLVEQRTAEPLVQRVLARA